ncbi:MAG: hypothetical protein PUE61_10860, partial [Clostridiales bacterium]|nr:hypothetical protein [Clostridiales bacterium]
KKTEQKNFLWGGNTTTTQILVPPAPPPRKPLMGDRGGDICGRTFLLKKISPPAPSQRKLILDITGRRKINLNSSDAKENGVCSAKNSS